MKQLGPTLFALALDRSPTWSGTFRRSLTAAVCVLSLSGSVHAQTENNAIETIDVVQIGAGSAVRFNFEHALTSLPDNFAVAKPATISFDFKNTKNGVGYRLKDIAQGDLRDLVLVESDTRLRAVMRLRSSMHYNAVIEGKSLLVSLTPVASSIKPSQELIVFPSAPMPSASRVAVVLPEQKVIAVPVVEAVPAPYVEPIGARTTDPSNESAVHSIRDIDFRRGDHSEGKIIVDLSDSMSMPNIKQTAQVLTIEFDKTQAADVLKKKVNVNDFGTPVKMITTTSVGNKIKMIIEPKGDWKYNAYMADKRLVVEVTAVVNDPTKLVQGEGTGYRGEKLSLNFQNIDIRALLNVIADYTKLNIIASDTVQGSITLHLTDVPWDQALDIILQSRGLDMRKRDSVIWVAPRDEISKREKDMLESQQQISDIEPLKTENFQLSYAKASELAAVLTNEKQRILSKRGSVVVDPRTNQVFVQDIPRGLEEARKVIKKIDIYMRQVQIEARIVEASDTFGKTLGARLGLNNSRTKSFSGYNVGIGGGLGTTALQTGQYSSTGASGVGPDTTYTNDGLSVNLPATPSASGAASGLLSLVLFNNAATRFLNLELSALEADGRGKIISSPRVVTADQEKALIEQGTELPYQQASASGATTVSFRKANLSLQVQPHITPDGNIIMDVEISKDAPGAVTAGGIAISTKHVKTKVMIENGGTVVIGGIYTQDERTDINKIPLLGDLPVAGALFRNKTRSDNKTELLIFLTPMVLDSRINNGE